MPTFLIATGPAITLFARLNEWRADRKHASLVPAVEISPIPWSNATHSSRREELEAFKTRNRGDLSKLQGSRHWPRFPPIV
jgi:hypothetical protein